MQQPINWEDLRLFGVVARSASLRAAAGEAGVSAATLSRRIDALERALGSPLLVRDAAGMRPTPDGLAVLAQIEIMARAALDVMRIGEQDIDVVRIAAGFWSARFYGQRLPAELASDPRPPVSRTGPARISIDWLEGSERLDIIARDAHIGLRNARPDEPALATRRRAQVEFAAYRARGSERLPEGAEWIVAGSGSTPSARWMESRGEVAARVSNPALLLPLLAADAGMSVLPTFAGDAEIGLERVGDAIAELAHEQWLVVHADDRHLPAVRRTVDALVAIAARDSRKGN